MSRYKFFGFLLLFISLGVIVLNILSLTSVQAQGSQYVFTHTVTSDWTTGYCATVTVTNNSSQAVNGWTLTWTFPGSQQITSLWDGSHTQTGANVSVVDAGWNSVIAANGGSVAIGYCANGTAATPLNFALNGTVQPTATSAPPTATSGPATSTSVPATATSAPPTATSAPPTATQPPGGSCTAPAWSATAVYVANDEVSHNGHQWRAKWWTQGEEPGTTGEWGVWLDLGPCHVSTSTPVPPTNTPVPTITPGGPTLTPTPTVEPGGNEEVVAYFTQWGIYARNYHVKNIVTSGAADQITVINYAFANIVNGECVMVTQTGVMDGYADYQKSYSAAESVDGVADVWDQPLKGNFNQLRKLKQMYPNIKVLISIGGWTWSAGFSDAALTPASRAQAVASCIDIYIHGNLPVEGGAGGPGAAAGVFDGIDIDWEYPAAPANTGHVYRPEDTQNFTLFLAEFRQQLDAIDPNLLLTIAAPAGVDKYEKIQLNQIHQYLDWINLMTYDMHGAWESTTNFSAPLYPSPNDPSPYPANTYAVDTAVQAYLAAGIPPNKLIVGIPFYGRGWTGVNSANNGLYQSASGPAPGTYEQGVDDYKVIKNLGYPQFRDPTTGAFWVFNGNTFWTYDDPVVITNKMNYIFAHGLRGAMVWSLDGDDANGTLLTTIHNSLQP